MTPVVVACIFPVDVKIRVFLSVSLGLLFAQQLPVFFDRILHGKNQYSSSCSAFFYSISVFSKIFHNETLFTPATFQLSITPIHLPMYLIKRSTFKEMQYHTPFLTRFVNTTAY